MIRFFYILWHYREIVHCLQKLYLLLVLNNIIPKEKPMPPTALDLIASITAGVNKLIAGQGSPLPTTNFATPDIIAGLQTLDALANSPAPAAPAPSAS